jgi:adenylate kinase
MQLLRERLGQLDCVSRGWILHGFPRNREQAEALERAGYAPNRVFFMNLPNDSIIERMTLRSVDSVTGHNYHLLFNPPSSKEVTERLRQNPKDLEQTIRNKVTNYFVAVKELAEYYENIGLNINVDQDVNTVFETIESGIVNKKPLHIN